MKVFEIATRGLLGLWILLSLVLGGALAFAHDVRLPVLLAPSGPAQGVWTAQHLLATRCRCSRSILEHLRRRGALPQWSETITLVEQGTSEPLRVLQEGGFQVTQISAAELEEMCGQAAVPLLIVRDPQGETRYTGAYAASTEAPAQDLAIFAQLRSGQAVPLLSISGCAVGRNLQRQIDPLGLKTGDWK